MTKVAINGFGRIGRLLFRRLLSSESIKVVAVNDLVGIKTLTYLLRYDSAQGKLKNQFKIDEKNNTLVFDGGRTLFFSEKQPELLPWKDLRIDIVVESTGLFLTSELCEKHLSAGAKKVIMSAPSKSQGVKTIVFGINHNTLSSGDKIISCASCTTNCLAPVVNVLEKEFGIVCGFMNTIHAYTADQRLQDAPHKDLRRGRAGAYSLVPTGTGAAKAIGLVIPSVAGKLDGIAVRAPVLTGSVCDITVTLKQSPSVSEINERMKSYANESFAYCEDPIVSADIVGDEHGSVFDSLLTQLVESGDQRMYKLFSWYDNESSYVAQLLRTLEYFSKIRN